MPCFSWQFFGCPFFGDGDLISDLLERLVVGDFQRSGMKRSLFESPGNHLTQFVFFGVNIPEVIEATHLVSGGSYTNSLDSLQIDMGRSCI